MAEKPKYEKPTVVSMDADFVTGQASCQAATGSADPDLIPSCGGPGDGASEYCQPTGNSAGINCSAPGNTAAVICIPGGSTPG